MPCQLQFADWVASPPSKVFAFFANPENLPRMMPPETSTKVDGFQLVPPAPLPDQDPISLHHEAGRGSIIDTSFRPVRFLSWRRKWTAAITEFEWNRYFADVQQKGPFKRWHHRHEFMPDARNGFNGTLVRDMIEYEVGYGPFGALANSLFIERRIRYVFAYRQKILSKLLEPPL
jgi:ligand-binding SRPBCC domain-containing protein